MLKPAFNNSPIASDDLSSNWEFRSKDDCLSQIEEFSAIPNTKDLERLKENIESLHKQLIQKISSLKNIEKILKPEEIDELQNLNEVVFIQGENGVEMSIYIDYVDRLRRLQIVAVKISQQVSKLQWEVDRNYCDNLEWNSKVEKDSRCDLESVKVCTKCSGCRLF
jgi:hypothetical protein